VDQARAPHPTAELVHPIAALGRTSTIDVHLADVGTGLAWSRVEVESGGTTTVLASETYPAVSWRGSGLLDTTSRSRSRRSSNKFVEGPRRSASSPATTRGCAGSARSPDPGDRFTIDLTAPTIEVLSQQHYLTLGGLDFMLYKTSPDAVDERRRRRHYFFPGTAGLFDDPAIRGAFFAVRRISTPRPRQGRRRGRRGQPPRGQLSHGREAAHLRRQDARGRRRVSRAQGAGDPHASGLPGTARPRPGLSVRESHHSPEKRGAIRAATHIVGPDTALGRGVSPPAETARRSPASATAARTATTAPSSIPRRISGTTSRRFAGAVVAASTGVVGSRSTSASTATR
jgi:hypothetical protein